MTKNLSRWCFEAHDLAKAKGWYDPMPEVGTRIALIHSEVSELLEAIRKDVPDLESIDGKPEGPASEAADVFLRLVDFCAWQGIDLERAVEAKHAYNRTRTHRHGGRPF